MDDWPTLKTRAAKAVSLRDDVSPPGRRSAAPSELRRTVLRMPRPVVVGGRMGFCSRAIHGPGPSQNHALCGSPPAKCSSASASYWCEGGTPLGALVLVRATCRLRHSRFGQRSCPRPLRSRGQLPCRRSRAGSFRQQKPTVPRGGPARFCCLHSKVRQLAALACLGLMTPAAPGEPAPALRCCASIRGAVPVRGEGSAPLGRWCALTLFGPFQPRPRRPSAFPQRRSLPLLVGIVLTQCFESFVKRTFASFMLGCSFIAFLFSPTLR